VHAHTRWPPQWEVPGPQGSFRLVMQTGEVASERASERFYTHTHTHTHTPPPCTTPHGVCTACLTGGAVPDTPGAGGAGGPWKTAGSPQTVRIARKDKVRSHTSRF